MIVDVAKCENCCNCFVATKDEHVGNDFPGYAAPQPLHGHQWIDMRRCERGQYPTVDANFMPVMCNHCDNAPCIRAARERRRLQTSGRDCHHRSRQSQRAKADRRILSLRCGLLERRPDGSADMDLRRYLLDGGWTRTRAEQVCPTGALRSVKVTDQAMRTISEREKLEVLLPQRNTKPRVHYKNLHLMSRCFVGGTIRDP